MAKKKQSNRNNVNWSNPKVQAIINFMQLGENRITKSEIMNLGNKDIMYQLKNSGFIKETEKGQFVGTKKLHSHVCKMDNSHFSSSGSREHSQKVRDSLSLLPKSVLERRAFKSSYDIEKRFDHTVLKSQAYKETLHAMRQNTKDCIARLQCSYESALQRCTSDFEKFNLRLSYIKEMEHYESQLSYLSEKPYLIPDYEVTLNENERAEYLDKLQSYRDTLTENTRAHDFCTESIDKIKSLPEGAITLSIEIATSTYEKKHIFLHEQYEVFSNTPQIILM